MFFFLGGGGIYFYLFFGGGGLTQNNLKSFDRSGGVISYQQMQFSIKGNFFDAFFFFFFFFPFLSSAIF